jgi:hypothetical protein
MADVPIPGYQTLWTNKLSALKSEYQTLVQQYPEADAQLKQLLQVLGDIEDVARHIPATIGDSAEWSAIVNSAEENGVSYCKGLHGEPLFSALCGTYAVTSDELKDLLKASTLADQSNSPKATGQNNKAGGWFPRSTEAEAARPRRNRRNFQESGSIKQNAARLKHPPPRRSSPETFSPPQGSGNGHRCFRY